MKPCAKIGPAANLVPLQTAMRSGFPQANRNNSPRNVFETLAKENRSYAELCSIFTLHCLASAEAADSSEMAAAIRGITRWLHRPKGANLLPRRCIQDCE